MRRCGGQVLVYFLMVIVAVFLLALLNVDTFLAVRAKNRLQNGGDAAALAAAARQGEILNEIGRLNAAHLAAAAVGDRRQAAALEAEQRRLALIEPVYALRAANAAAKKNGLEERAEFAAVLEDHVRTVRSLYAGGGGDTDPLPESYPGAWTDYAAAIADVLDDGLAVGPDNVEFHAAYGRHLLLNRDFYNAIAGEDWCWFHFHCEGALAHYTSYLDWPPLDGLAVAATENSEIFPLHVAAWRGALTDVFTADEVARLANRFAGTRLTADDIAGSDFQNPSNVWFFFDAAHWGAWFDGRRLAGDPDGADFPLAGDVRPEYNVRGCGAVCRTAKTAESFATDAAHDFTWSAAAKPFGTVEDLAGERGAVTALKGFIVPCMTDTRLIPVDAAPGANLATADYAWVLHVRNHLGDYLLNGPKSNGGCWYCEQLRTWEHASFHTRGTRWLRHHAGECVRPIGGGAIGTGGTSRGH